MFFTQLGGIILVVIALLAIIVLGFLYPIVWIVKWLEKLAAIVDRRLGRFRKDLK